MILKTEDVSLTPNAKQISQVFIFSGIDNGIVKMSESSTVTFDKYVYHLKLYNRFAVLDEEELKQEEPNFQVLLGAKAIVVKDVDF
ncbi:uncharacterized protein B0P05DRAFT_550182 [Gilbertella persicaria]|uniref:uncharacterized protein n=1 Tax=Gilbertella persicaria TaxID=101096 RepID=UPI00221EC274|nr:uncharacterized protein B0P05DRAFT_550182 [Gilbertella persicaria]KAI8070557.1 hypothetical protein B0P05DRAFT_550182 [Gilbertella persicaria]